MLKNLKEEVLEIAILAEEAGLCRHGGGNFSMINRKKGLIAITPSGIPRDELEPQDLLVIDLNGNIVENRMGFKPSSETPMHTAIYREREDAVAICHTHAKNATAFSCMGGVPVKPVAYESLFYGGICRVAPFAEPGSIELGRSAIDYMKGTDAVILGNHGLVTIGRNAYDAYLKTCYVEDVCEINLKAASVVGYDNITSLSDEDIQFYRPRFGFSE